MLSRKPGDWDCDKCGVHNFKKRLQCFGCGTYRTQTPGWTCNACHCENYPDRLKCFRCGADKDKDKAVDWKCQQCGFLVFASKTQCPKCHPMKREGDWDCSNCGKFQFARNKFCRDCGQARDEADDSACVVCMDAPRDTMLMHGATGHTCCCGDCAQILLASELSCPICRAPIERVVKNFG